MVVTSKARRQFSDWVADQIELVCARNDVPRPGHEFKPAWEKVSTKELYWKIDEEIFEFLDAYAAYRAASTEENRKALQWEAADAAAVLMMLSARVDPEMQKLRRGR